MTTAKNEFFSNINIWLVREGEWGWGGGVPIGGISFDGSDGRAFEKIHR